MMKQLGFSVLPGEAWWGGSVHAGHEMPLTAQSVLTLDPDRGRENDQFAPLYVSSMGRYLWSERPFVLEAKAGRVECRGTGEILMEEGFGDLRGAYLGCLPGAFSLYGNPAGPAAFSPSPSIIRGSSWARIRPRRIFSATPGAFWRTACLPGF